MVPTDSSRLTSIPLSTPTGPATEAARSLRHEYAGAGISNEVRDLRRGQVIVDRNHIPTSLHRCQVYLDPFPAVG